MHFWKYLVAIRDLSLKIYKSYLQGGSMHNKVVAAQEARRNARRRAAETPNNRAPGLDLDVYINNERGRGRGPDNLWSRRIARRSSLYNNTADRQSIASVDEMG